ncbi:MAG: hypothetical protein HOV71_27000, partial [Hamadaea sp.]|nr:hypothetical protein [Hamadaea sp.]NUR51790.1 hypothetical protein [Hamadaea sp.]NUT07431.1 hypothetical protein [Hamadaea sp.]
LRIHGAAWQTHPAEVARLTEEARAAGVEINLRDGIGMAYGPAPTAGSPGVMVLDREASYGAWLHEFRHMRDDREAGWLGMRGWFSDAEVRAGSEIRAYDVEIQYAEQIGDTASAERLRLLRDEEVRMIMEGDR